MPGPGGAGAGRTGAIPHHVRPAKSGLDADCRWPHLTSMTQRKDNPGPPRETQSEREKRLAEALRANLKRRKAAKKPE